jgi:hypothetical protein
MRSTPGLVTLEVAEVLFGLLFAFLDFAVEVPAGLIVDHLASFLDALVRDVRMLAGELFRVLLEITEIWHGSSLPSQLTDLWGSTVAWRQPGDNP